MTTITVTYSSEDAYQFAQAHLAPHAWRAIDEALATIRNHRKHDNGTAAQCLADIALLLGEARSRIEDDPQTHL